MKKVKFKVECDLTVKKNGEILLKKTIPVDSLTGNFLRLIRALWMGRYGETVYGTVKKGDGTNCNVHGSIYHSGAYGHRTLTFSIKAGGEDDSFGIVVGSGDEPFDKDDYCLSSKISNGTGSGQLVYGAVTIEDINISDTEASFRVSRAFTNNSGADVVVKEIGIVGYCYHKDDPTVYTNCKFLFLRDVLSTPVTIVDGARLTVRYTFKIAM